MYLCVLYGSQNKQRLFPYTALTDWFYNRDLTLCIPVFTICTTSLIFTNSTFCPHNVFMCFVWISEQTAIISLYNINWLGFITERECVYWAVRTQYLFNSCYFPSRKGLIVLVMRHKNAWIYSTLTLRRLMSYIYGAPILDVSRSHTTT